mgnify:CR=1 FL=1
MPLIIPPDIEKKIGQDDHDNITVKEVHECFANHCGRYAYDKRPEHLDGSGQPSPWFVANTNHGRCLKIMFVHDGGDVYLKSAYPATVKVQDVYNRYAK